MSAKIDAARDAAITRAPIFNKALEVVAYEIILASGPMASVSVTDAGADGAPRLVVNSGVEVDLAISAGKPVLLNMAAPALVAGLPPALGPKEVMLMLGAGVDVSAETVAAVERLVAQGIRIVLEDLATNPQLHQLLRHAHAVKIKVGRTATPGVAKQIGLLKTTGVELIADGVATYDDLRDATRLGVTRFQGPFLGRPDGFRKSQAPAGQLAALELITKLQDPDAAISEIANVIRRDVNLSYRILKVVNSAHYALSRPLGSIEEAVVVVGTKQIVSWVGALSMTGLNGKPAELTRSAMIRARTCEMLARHLDRHDVQRFYIVGLLSVIEALLDVPAAQALGRLPLNAEIVDAIVSGGGILGETLRGVVEYEKGNWDRSHIIGIDDQALSDAFHLAMLEVDKVWAQITG
ncbi:MAG: HDOD domain-containing protein [Acidimicrobiia bacterium]